MDRRTLLAAAGGTLGTVAGCLGAPGTDDGPPGDEPATGTGTPTDPDAGDGGTTGGGDGTPVSALPCPPYPAGPDVVCAWTADRDAAPVVLVPSSTSTADPSSLRLRLHNRSSSALTFNPHSWRLHRRVDGDWTRIEQTVAGDGRLTVAAGATHAWTVREAVDAVDPDLTFRPGTYAPAIEVPVPTAGDGDDGTGGDDGDWVTCVAAFRVTDRA